MNTNNTPLVLYNKKKKIIKKYIFTKELKVGELSLSEMKEKTEMPQKTLRVQEI